MFNVACGARTTLVELFEAIPERVVRFVPSAEFATLKFDPPRADDILHSFASIDRAKEALGYEPSHNVARGVNETIAWYGPRLARASALASIDPGAPRHFAWHEPCVFHCQSPMTHSLSREMDTTVLRVRGVLDALSCPELRLVLDGLVEERKPAVTVDLSELRLIDSFGVGAMVSLYKRVRANGGEVRFVGVTAQPLVIFKLLRLDRAFALS